MNTATIHFEDQGQDFLEWDLEILNPVEAKIVACRPFQSSIWCGCHVMFDKNTKRGDKITFTRDFVNANEIKYPLTKIEKQVS